MTSGVRDSNHGMSALLKRLGDLDRAGAVRLTVGVHAEEGARPHPHGGTVATVATFVEMGTESTAPAGMIRSTIDQRRGQLAEQLATAGQAVLEGATVGEGFGPVVEQLTREVKARTPVDTGTVRDAIQGRIDGERVA